MIFRIFVSVVELHHFYAAPALGKSFDLEFLSGSCFGSDPVPASALASAPASASAPDLASAAAPALATTSLYSMTKF
jgi:hypothetical protein